MNARMRSWIRTQTDLWESRANAEKEAGRVNSADAYRQVAKEFRIMIRNDPWLARMDPTPSAEIMAQQIYESFGAAAYESGHSKVPFESSIQWADVPLEYRNALVETAGDILKSGMVELIVEEAMHRERLETGKRGLKFWSENRSNITNAKDTWIKMKRLAEGYVDD